MGERRLVVLSAEHVPIRQTIVGGSPMHSDTIAALPAVSEPSEPMGSVDTDTGFLIEQNSADLSCYDTDRMDKCRARRLRPGQ